MNRIGDEIVERWKEKLAEKFGRSVEDLSENGLRSMDFRHSSKVILSVPGELECTFNYAFSVVDPDISRVAVFTEHCGYHEFYLHGMKVSDIVTEEYWDEEYQA